MSGAFLIFILFIKIPEHQQLLDPDFFKQKLWCKNYIKFCFSINSGLVIYSLHNINFSEFLLSIQMINNLIHKYRSVGIFKVYLVLVIVFASH